MREITQKYGTLLILDEVGTGFSRTGTLFALEHESVVPDIVCFAKAQSNGVAPIGTMVTRDEIAEQTYDKSQITSTFGWLPTSVAAAMKVLEIHQRDEVWQKAETDGEYALNALRNELGNTEQIKDIRGVGMEIGVELESPEAAKSVRIAALNHGLHLPPGGSSPVLQIMPPLTIERQVLDEGLDKLFTSIRTSAVDKHSN